VCLCHLWLYRRKVHEQEMVGGKNVLNDGSRRYSLWMLKALYKCHFYS